MVDERTAMVVEEQVGQDENDTLQVRRALRQAAGHSLAAPSSRCPPDTEVRTPLRDESLRLIPARERPPSDACRAAHPPRR